MPIHGVKHGVKHGTTHGVSRTDLVTDATSGKGVPLTQAEVNSALAAAGMSSKTLAHSWGFQDLASGDIAATVGTNLTTTGTLDPQTARAGWTRKAMRYTATAGERSVLAAGVSPNPGTESVLWIYYVDFTAAAAANFLVATNSANPLRQMMTAAGLLRIHVNGVNTDGASDHAAGGVRPIVLLFDRTNSRAMLYSDLEKITGTYSAGVTDGTKGIGMAGASPLAGDVLWMLTFAGANAEWSDANVKSFLTALGWSIPWS